jgi:hypothetical protein
MRKCKIGQAYVKMTMAIMFLCVLCVYVCARARALDCAKEIMQCMYVCARARVARVFMHLCVCVCVCVCVRVLVSEQNVDVSLPGSVHP